MRELLDQAKSPPAVQLCLAAAAFVVALGACEQGPRAPEKVKLTISGSTALKPLLDKAAERYVKRHPNVAIAVRGGGSHVGLSEVAAGKVTFGASDIFTEDPALIDNRVAVVGFAVMAHKGAYNQAIDSLAGDEVRDIFRGEIKNWTELGGDDQPITVINREKSSGTREVFRLLALGGVPLVAGEEQASSGGVRDILRTRPGAISYLALPYRDDTTVTMSYNHVEPTPSNIMINRYPLWAYEHLYTRGKPSATAAEFLSFVASGRFQREVLPELGFIPLNDMRVVRDK